MTDAHHHWLGAQPRRQAGKRHATLLGALLLTLLPEALRGCNERIDERFSA